MHRIFALCLLLGAGGVAAHPGNHERLESLSHRLEQDPDSQYLHIQRGLAYLEGNQPELALEELQRAEHLGDPVVVAPSLGVYYYRQGQFDQSRQYFDRYLQAHPDDIQALQYRARLLRDAGDSRGALRDYQHLFSLGGATDPGSWISAANLMLELPDHGVAGALALLDQGIASGGAVVQLQRRAIELEKQRGNPAGAIERMRHLPANVQDTPDWKTELGLLYRQAGEEDRARAQFMAAHEQLSSLRQTPARQALSQQLDALLNY